MTTRADLVVDPGLAAFVESELLPGLGIPAERFWQGKTDGAYAYRSLVDPNGPRQQWLQANWGRLNMAIVAEAEAVGQQFVFSQIDGRGITIASFNGSLSAMLKNFYDEGALYGETAADAYVVNTGPAVNTPDTIADGRLRAVLSVRMSPHAELVQIEIVKYATTVVLA